MSLNPTFLATWLLGLGLLIVPPRASGQVPASDSAARAPSDSQPSPTDSAQTTGVSQSPSDTGLQRAAPDSVSTADSTRAPADSDSTRAPADSDRTRAPADTVQRPEPPDSILGAACGGPAGPATVARDLLVVVFAPEAGASERAATAKSVDGTLLGPVTGEPGAYYLRVPSGGEEYQLRVASDQLIQLDLIRQVGSRACPRLPLPDQAQQKSP
jgi:hypothetical protein